MQIHILEEAGQELAAIDNTVRRRELEIRRTQAVKPIERLYTFAGWTLDETVRDLVGPAGQRVDLTSSEFDLLIAFLRQPGQPLSRAALLGVLRGRQWTYFRSLDRYAGRAVAQETRRWVRSPSADSLGAGRWVRVLRPGRKAVRSGPIRRRSSPHAPGRSRAASLTLRRP
jgi:hypothetical protein